MNAWRALSIVVLTALGLGLGFAAPAAEISLGKDYLMISPPLAADNAKVEVTEFFWYGCPHCFSFEPEIDSWLKKLPADVSFRRVPAIFPNNQWTPGAALYYTLEAMNLLESLHDQVFNAIHVERKRLDKTGILHEWLANKGVDVKKFSEIWDSFGVRSRVQQARNLTLAAGINGVPALVVGGKYLVPSQGQSTRAEMLATVDQLVGRVRAASGGKGVSVAR